jgi:hypothetical protein
MTGIRQHSGAHSTRLWRTVPAALARPARVEAFGPNSDHGGQIFKKGREKWRKRMGIEPTGRPVKDEPTRFEDGGGHQSRAHFQVVRGC